MKLNTTKTCVFFLFSYVVLFHKHLSFKSLEFSGCCSIILKTQSWTLSPNMWQHSVSYTVQLMMNGFSFVLSLSSSGKQAKDKNPEEYIKPSVEWDTGVPWHHSSWHDYQNAQVGWLLCGHQLVLFPRRTCGQFIKWRRKLRPFNPLVDNQQPSVLPSWLIQVTHNCIQVTPTNCSTCCCSSVGSEVPAPSPLQSSADGVIEVERYNLGPKSLTCRCHAACLRRWRGEAACVLCWWMCLLCEVVA